MRNLISFSASVFNCIHVCCVGEYWVLDKHSVKLVYIFFLHWKIYEGIEYVFSC